MKKYPKIVQCDRRGQIVIPKDIRQELGIDEGSAFWMFSITEEGILLKMIPDDPLEQHSTIIKTVKEKAEKVGIKEDNINQTVDKYKRRPKGNLEDV